MGVTAAVVAIGSAAHAYDTGKEAKEAAAQEQAKLDKAEAERKRKIAEATPFSGTDAGRRVALEKQQLRRSAGRGRAGTVINKQEKLG